MKISIYTIARDCIYFDFHLEAMLKHHLPFADEIVINEGYSKDDTYERIQAINSPKIKMFREEWGTGSAEHNMYAAQKDLARARCTGDWCILLDSDEFIPEWLWDTLRTELPNAPRPIIQMTFLNFYGNYRVLNTKPEKKHWPARKYVIHRNDPKMKVWGDGSNVEFDGNRDTAIDKSRPWDCHHMGFVRNPARLRHKWKIQHKLNLANPVKDRTPGFLFDVAPHNWFDPEFMEDLTIYDGPLVEAVRQDTAEFTRDDMKLYEHLSQTVARETK